MKAFCRFSASIKSVAGSPGVLSDCVRKFKGGWSSCVVSLARLGLGGGTELDWRVEYDRVLEDFSGDVDFVGPRAMIDRFGGTKRSGDLEVVMRQ